MSVRHQAGGVGTGSIDLLDYRRRTAQLYADVREASRTSGPEVGHRLWRTGRDRLFAEHPQSPLLPDDPRRRTGLPTAAYDPALRWALPLEAAAADVPAEERAGRLEVTTGTDGAVGYQRLGRVVTPLGPLDVWWLTGYGGGVWLPVRDASSGSTSYGGGRYLLDTVKGADLGTDDARPGSLVVDLNFLYNPSCAYDPAWACPLAPPGDRLDVAVEAGELLSSVSRPATARRSSTSPA